MGGCGGGIVARFVVVVYGARVGRALVLLFGLFNAGFALFLGDFVCFESLLGCFLVVFGRGRQTKCRGVAI